MADITATGPVAAAELDRHLTAGYTLQANGATVTVSAPGYTTNEVTAAVIAAGGSGIESTAATIRGQAATALSGNRTFLGLNSPTNAQTLAQVKALTRQNNALIRLVLGRFDGTD